MWEFDEVSSECAKRGVRGSTEVGIEGAFVVALFLALAAFGFYTSQAGRLTFKDEPGEQRPK